MEDLIQNLTNKKFQIELPSHLWGAFDCDILNVIRRAEWKTFKYFSINRIVSEHINSIDDTKGGIYVFYVSPEIIPKRQRILLYVGRAHISQRQNLRKRVKEYVRYLPPDYARPKISWMMKEWGDYLYCSYIELEDNVLIDQIEKELIIKLIPPFNDMIPDKKISAAVKAAGLQ